MKNILLIFLLPVFVSAQTVTFDTEHKDSEGGFVAQLSDYNNITAMVDGMTCNDFFLTTDNGTFLKLDEDCKWYYVPHREDYGTIFFNKIVDGDTVVFHQKRLSITIMKFIPTFTPFFPEKGKTLYLTNKQLLESTLHISVFNDYYDKEVLLNNVDIQVRRNNKDVFSKRMNKGTYKINPKTIRKLRKLKKGDIVTFMNIKYEYPNENGEPFIFETYNVRVEII